MNDDEKIFLDTNILVYAFDTSENIKHKKCKKLISDCFEGERNFYISNQVLAEFVSVMLTKIKIKYPQEKMKKRIQEINSIDSWKKINYSTNTIESLLTKQMKTSFWDALIAETMKESLVFTIYTENIKDFEKIEGIKAVNPLK
ncbi:MAG: PIN domain-containing protein [Candidatus Diapherotrites archaeon]